MSVCSEEPLELAINELAQTLKDYDKTPAKTGSTNQSLGCPPPNNTPGAAGNKNIPTTKVQIPKRPWFLFFSRFQLIFLIRKKTNSSCS